MTRRVPGLSAVTLIVALSLSCQLVSGRPTATSVKRALPLEWPVSPLTQEQIAEVKNCDLDNLPKQRYPTSVPSNDLPKTYPPKTSCDWAVLALAYADQAGEGAPLSEPAKDAFSQAVLTNPGYALATPLFYRYFGNVSLVKAPPLAQKKITDVKIEYSWGGLGKSVDYSAEIHRANTIPAATSTISPSLIADKALVQALASGLTDLLPVNSTFQMQPCTDNYPSWILDLTFADKTTLTVSTNSNFMYMGGPWFTEIDHQTYMQASPVFGIAV
jgi:hypothetical protein